MRSALDGRSPSLVWLSCSIGAACYDDECGDNDACAAQNTVYTLGGHTFFFVDRYSVHHTVSITNGATEQRRIDTGAWWAGGGGGTRWLSGAGSSGCAPAPGASCTKSSDMTLGGAAAPAQGDDWTDARALRLPFAWDRLRCWQCCGLAAEVSCCGTGGARRRRGKAGGDQAESSLWAVPEPEWPIVPA